MAKFTPTLRGDGFTSTDSFNVMVAACAETDAETQTMNKNRGMHGMGAAQTLNLCEEMNFLSHTIPQSISSGSHKQSLMDVPRGASATTRQFSY